ncbi:MAG: iron ABC transporter permease [Gemmatimonadota bacterium]
MIFRLVALTVAVAAVALLGLGIGASGLGLAGVLDVLRGTATGIDRDILLGIRAPRVVLAGLVGGSLGISGAVLQALLRNPLAEPFVLGVSGGAAVGAVLAIGLGGSFVPGLVPLSATVGALAATAAVLRIARAVGPALSPRVLILAGVVVSAFFNAIILLLLALSSTEGLRQALYWMMGNLSGASWGAVGMLAGFAAPALLWIVSQARPLNLLALGEEPALYLGVSVERTRTAALAVTSVLVGAAVAVSGIIGFVGLVIPHAFRLLWGSDHRLLLPASALGGAAFLIATDTVARTLVSPVELPTGVITALIGVPVFLLLLVRRGT